MSFKKYLKHPSTQTSVDKIVADIYPILQQHFEEEDISPWELATALVVLLSSVASSTDLDKDTMVQLAMETSPDEGLFSVKH